MARVPQGVGDRTPGAPRTTRSASCFPASRRCYCLNPLMAAGVSGGSRAASWLRFIRVPELLLRPVQSAPRGSDAVISLFTDMRKYSQLRQLRIHSIATTVVKVQCLSTVRKSDSLATVHIVNRSKIVHVVTWLTVVQKSVVPTIEQKVTCCDSCTCYQVLPRNTFRHVFPSIARPVNCE